MTLPHSCRGRAGLAKLSATGGDAINQLTDIPARAQPVAQPRARGQLRLGVAALDGHTRLRALRQAGSAKLMFPRPRSPRLEAVWVNTAGGVTGGDSFHNDFDVGAGAAISLTSQAAERAYKAQPGETGRIRTRIGVGEGGSLHWMPQETILFEGCALHRSLQVDLAASASALLVEPLVFGRAAMGERLSSGHFNDRIEITREGAPLFSDAMCLTGDIASHLARPTIAGGAAAMALVVCVDAGAEASLAPVRSMLNDTSGATLIGEDVLVARVLATDGFDLRRVLIPVLTHLSGGALPRTWMF